MEKLKPCKCGKVPIVIEHTDGDNLVTTYYPLCFCGATTREQYDTPEQARKAWNTRKKEDNT